MPLCRSDRAHLLIVDVQSRLVPAIEDAAAVVANVRRLLGYAAELGVPVTLTEHAPDRIGGTLPEVMEAAPRNAVRVTKQAFSSWREPAFEARIGDLRDAGRNQIVVAGMEAHVCVCQTILDLLDNGFTIFLVADAVSSRTAANRSLAVDRIARAGGQIVSQEMVAFEWLGRGDTEAFRRVLPLIK